MINRRKTTELIGRLAPVSTILPIDEDPLHVPSSTFHLEGPGLIVLNHDDGNEWSWGTVTLRSLWYGKFIITDVYNRNEQFFPDDWIPGRRLTIDEIIQAFSDFKR